MREHDIAVPADLLAAHPEASEVYVARAGALLGAIVIADAVRPEARDAVAAIHAMGIKTVLLTGDSRAVAESADVVLSGNDLLKFVETLIIARRKDSRISRC